MNCGLDSSLFLFYLSIYLFGPKHVPEIVRLGLNRRLCDSATLKTILHFL